jgi:hypothetical protein
VSLSAAGRISSTFPEQLLSHFGSEQLSWRNNFPGDEITCHRGSNNLSGGEITCPEKKESSLISQGETLDLEELSKADEAISGWISRISRTI